MPFPTHAKFWIIAGLTCLVIIIAVISDPFAQAVSFHDFADQRTMLGIPNCLNVISNIPFVLIGAYGLSLLRRGSISMIYAMLFVGVLLTGFGSAYYHNHPDNNTLVYDRIPMTIVFTSFLAATISERMNLKLGKRLLFPLIVTGIFSVLWWHHTEQIGAGDLRIYMVVQFYPVILIPIIFWLFPVPGSRRTTQYFLWIIGWYLIAKVLEHFDDEIFSALGFVSGHSLKHLAAAVSTWYILKIYLQKRGNL